MAFEMSLKAETSFVIEFFFFICFGELFARVVEGTEIQSRGAFQDIGGTRRSLLLMLSPEYTLEGAEVMQKRRWGA